MGNDVFYGMPGAGWCDRCHNDGEFCECCLKHGDPDCEHKECN